MILTAKNFLLNTPVQPDNVRQWLAIANGWKFNSPADNRDVKELYGLIAYFIGNHVLDYLEKQPATISEDMISALKAVGITRFDQVPDNLRTKFNKLAAYTVLGDLRYLMHKGFGAVSGELNTQVHLQETAEIQTRRRVYGATVSAMPGIKKLPIYLSATRSKGRGFPWALMSGTRAAVFRPISSNVRMTEDSW